MPSIMAGLQPQGADPRLSSIDEVARAPVGPWLPSVPLPMPEVEWAQTVGPGELSEQQTWPPVRLQPRQERLQAYHDLWRGDLGRFIDRRQLTVNSVGATNIFRRITRFVADLLVREVPTVGDDAGATADTELMRVVHSAATQAIKTGLGALLFTRTSAGPMIRALDSRWTYRTIEGGWLMVEPRNLTTNLPGNTIPDALSAISVGPDGNAMAFVLAGTPTGIGTNITVGPVTSGTVLGEATVEMALALPEQAEGFWGTSWYDDLITVCVQKARRMASMTKVLDGNSDPLLLMRGNLDDYTTVPGVPPSVAVSGAAADPQAAAMVARRLRQIGPLLAPAGVEQAEYITWDGNLESATALMAEINRDFRMLSGMPAMLDEETVPASGMSLRRQFWQSDAGVAPLFHGLHGALSRGLQFLGAGELEWANTFEQIAESPMMNEREDVEDEVTARRGEGDEQG